MCEPECNQRRCQFQRDWHTSVIFLVKEEAVEDWLRSMKTYIEDMHFSTRNVVAVPEEMGQFNGLFKMLLSDHEEYNAIFQYEYRLKKLIVWWDWQPSIFVEEEDNMLVKECWRSEHVKKFIYN